MNGQTQTPSLQSNNYNAALNTAQNRQMSNLSHSRAFSSNPRNTLGVRLRPVSDLRQASFNVLTMPAKDSL